MRVLLLAASAALAAGACSVDPQAFQKRIFNCDVADPDPGCGVDQAGSPMMCVADHAFGPTDFCAARCTAAETAAPPAGSLCLNSGAKLQTCNPAQDTTSADGGSGDNACGRPELGCLRTDLLSDEGVCLTMTPCEEDTDCRDGARSTCATSLVNQIYPHATGLHDDHLYCLQVGCQERGSSCPSGESCLRNVIPAEAHPPDICVPTCDSNLRCPPNHFCYRKVSSPAAPAVCIPGLLGFSCESNTDCLVGDCLLNDAGFSLCTTTCADDTDCAKFDGDQGQFLCNADKHCVTPNAFRGSICYSASDCKPTEQCTFLSATSKSGSCAGPCDAQGLCAPRAGVPHTCVDPGAPQNPICFPGYFGLPCTQDSECLPTLTCRPTAQLKPTTLCTTLCNTDDDCAQNRWAAAGWCDSVTSHICLPPLSTGLPCDHDRQCASGRCLAATTSPASKVCTEVSL